MFNCLCIFNMTKYSSKMYIKHQLYWTNYAFKTKKLTKFNENFQYVNGKLYLVEKEMNANGLVMKDAHNRDK